MVFVVVLVSVVVVNIVVGRYKVPVGGLFEAVSVILVGVFVKIDAMDVVKIRLFFSVVEKKLKLVELGLFV